jgi:hypothetical protein
LAKELFREKKQKGTIRDFIRQQEKGQVEAETKGGCVMADNRSG